MQDEEYMYSLQCYAVMYKYDSQNFICKMKSQYIGCSAMQGCAI